MSSKASKYLLVAMFLLGILVGIFAQRYHLPGTLLRQVSSIRHTGLFQTKDVSRHIDHDDPRIALRLRDFQQAVDPENFDTEQDGQEIYLIEEIPLSRLALILMDVWDNHPNDGWTDRERENVHARLLPLVQAARRRGILIVHSPHGRSIHESVAPLPQEIVVDGPNEQAELLQLLHSRGIEYLLYAGYASNMCVLTRPTGIIEMSRHGYRIILVRDASIAVETPESLEAQWNHYVAVHVVEINWGATTTVDDVIAALEAQ